MGWQFARLGGVDQALFRSAEDVLRIGELDQKLWMALACPIDGVAIDRRTLELIDLDHDGRIRTGELIKTAEWLAARLEDVSGIEKQSDQLPLSSLRPEVRERLAPLSGGAHTIALADVEHALAKFYEQPLNGDGVITPEAAHDPSTTAILGEMIAVMGGELDRSGKPGVNKAKADAFFAGIDALAHWMQQSRLEVESGASVARVKSKVEDYFARCRLAAFDPRSIGPLNRSEELLVAIAAEELGAASDSVAKLPLARVEPSRALPLGDGVNPAWRAAIDALKRDAVLPALGDRAVLDPEGWATILARLPPDHPAAKLGSERIRAIAASDAKQQITELIDADLAKASEHALLVELEQIIRCQRDLKTVVENYVSFVDFYHPAKLAAFQAGRLLMDGRSAELCLPVDDVTKHSTLSPGSKMYLAYCEVYRKAQNEKRSICAAFTNGSGETLFVGRNGIFYDRDGKEWDATIVKVVEAPISLREAFWSPWRKIGKMIEGQLNKLLAAREAAAQEAAAQSIEGTATPPPPKPPEAPQSGVAMASAAAAIGIALGFLSTAVATVMGFVAGLPLWKTALGVVGVVLLVSGPSVGIAYFRLRQRDLAPLLNASGWAINRSILLSLKLGRKLTALPHLPAGSRRELRDPYADSTARRNLLLLLLVAAALGALWWFGFLDPIIDAVIPPQ
jgi:hypothetical protein